MNMLIPLVLVGAIIAAWIFPTPGAALSAAGLAPWLVALIFLINGYQTDLGRRPGGRALIFAIGLMAVINLVLGPMLGLAAVRLLDISGGLALGMIVMAAMPPTLSSGIVLTVVAGGDALWALLFTIALNILGIIAIPITIPEAAALGEGIAIDPWPLFEKLLIVVLMPFLLGQVARHLIGSGRYGNALKHIPTLCIAAAVWMVMSKTALSTTLSALPFSALGLTAIGAFGVHGLLFALCWVVAKMQRLPDVAVSAFVFTGSQKTLPVAVGILATLQVEIGHAVLACVAFHFVQLFLDSWIAGAWGKSSRRSI